MTLPRLFDILYPAIDANRRIVLDTNTSPFFHLSLTRTFDLPIFLMTLLLSHFTSADPTPSLAIPVNSISPRIMPWLTSF